MKTSESSPPLGFLLKRYHGKQCSIF